MQIKQLSNKREWLEARQKGIGGSDVAVITGISPWTTPEQLALQKTQPIGESTTNGVLEMGHIMEDVIFQKYVKKDFPNAINYDNAIITNANYPVFQGSPDALTPNQIIEIKFVNLYGVSNWKDDTGEFYLPDYYKQQVLLYMAAANKRKGKVYAFFQTDATVRIFDVIWDEELVNNMNIQSVDFMDNVVNLAQHTPTDEPKMAEVEEPDLLTLHKLNREAKEAKIKADNLKSILKLRHPLETKLYYNHLSATISKSGQIRIK